MLRIVGSLVVLLFCVNSAHAGLMFTAPAIVGLPGDSGTLFLGINSDIGTETLNYELSAFAIDPLSDLDIVVNEATTGTAGMITVPAMGDAPVLLAIGTYEILGNASPGDMAKFAIGMRFSPKSLSGGSSFDSEGAPPVIGSVMASGSVVPEPTSLVIFCCLGVCPLFCRRRSFRT